MKKLTFIALILTAHVAIANQEVIDAINSENFSKVEKLIKNKSHLIYKDANGHDVLYHAVSLNEPKLVKKIVLAGAKIDQVYNEAKESILFEATRLGSKEVVEFLLLKKPNLLKQKNSKGESVLAEALKAKQNHLADLYKTKGLTK